MAQVIHPSSNQTAYNDLVDHHQRVAVSDQKLSVLEINFAPKCPQVKIFNPKFHF